MSFYLILKSVAIKHLAKHCVSAALDNSFDFTRATTTRGPSSWTKISGGGNETPAFWVNLSSLGRAVLGVTIFKLNWIDVGTEFSIWKDQFRVPNWDQFQIDSEIRLDYSNEASKLKLVKNELWNTNRLYSWMMFKSNRTIMETSSILQPNWN